MIIVNSSVSNELSNRQYHLSAHSSHHPPVHDGTPNESQTEESRAGVLEDLESPVVEDQQYDNNAGDRAEQRD